MLIEFEGTINEEGLCEFRQSSNRQPAVRTVSRLQPHVRFWAVLESGAASRVLEQHANGRRAAALRLLEESAVSLGSLPDAPNG